ncbi:MAG: hypothetical protein JWP08_594 [Bryobacterales bacterium]|nr:hypothetical protein [Bryobacterales bacterium]
MRNNGSCVRPSRFRVAGERSSSVQRIRIANSTARCVPFVARLTRVLILEFKLEAEFI